MLCLTLKQKLSLVLLSVLIAAPVAAHTVKVSGDVGATFHIDPNDNPKAGQPSLAWFALTRKRGWLIPLSQCNCQLAVYSQPRSQNSQPILKPTLRAIKAEQYQDIPGAEIVFPQPGAYELELSGTPKAGAEYKPFRLTYAVTVGA